MAKANSYPKHTIGEHIVNFDLTFRKEDSVGKTLKIIKKKIGSWPNTKSIYVVDKNNKLVGSVEFKELLAGKPEQKLEELMNRWFQALTDHSHQKTAIKLAIKEGMGSIPVTDQNGHFLGIIDAEQILKIMHEEHVEKLMHFSGILNNESLVAGYKARAVVIAKSRLPWLLFGLAGGIIATLVVKRFSLTLEKELALAFFIPVIVYMNDAVGTQTETVFVRYSTLEKISLFKSLINEIKVTLILGVILSSILFIFSVFWLEANISLIVATSMLLGILSSSIIGTLIPWILEKLDKDPAIGSGPFTTILQDLISIVIYFSIARLFL